MCKMIISPGVFSIIENFDFYGCQGEGNGRVKKNQKIKNPVCRALYFRNHTSYDFHLWCTCVGGYYLQAFQFFKILIFRRRVKNGSK